MTVGLSDVMETITPLDGTLGPGGSEGARCKWKEVHLR